MRTIWLAVSYGMAKRYFAFTTQKAADAWVAKQEEETYYVIDVALYKKGPKQ